MTFKRLVATHRRQIGIGLAGAMLMMAAACASPTDQARQQEAAAVKEVFDTDETSGVPMPKSKEEIEAARKAYSPFAGKAYPRLALFGDTHNHTANSGDAYMGGNTLSPEQAYRFARGEEVVSSTGIPVRLSRPLDFLVVSDHAEGRHGRSHRRAGRGVPFRAR